MVAFNSALRRQRQVDLCKFKVSLVYSAGSRIVRVVTQKNPVSKNNQKNPQINKKERRKEGQRKKA